MESVEILGCRVDAVGRTGAVARIAELANTQHGALVITLGVEMVMQARVDRDFRRIVNAAALNVCDTIGLLLVSRLRRGPLRERVIGVELVAALAQRSAQVHDVRLYLLGGSDETAVRAMHRLTQRFPGARICGARDGYFHDDESDSVAATIAASGANVVCVGLGSPKQERWLARYARATGCGVGIGVGGSFDVLAGTVQRAPAFVQRIGFEWAYRLIREPRRWRRQLVLPHFMLLALRETIGRLSGRTSHQ